MLAFAFAIAIAIAIAAATTMFHHYSTVIVHNPQFHTFSPFPIFPSTATPRNFQPLQTLNFPLNRNLRSLYSSRYPPKRDDYSEYDVIGDGVVFEKGIFEDPNFHNDLDLGANKPIRKHNSKKKKKKVAVSEPNNLVPDKWREVQAEIYIRRKKGQEIELNSKKKRGPVPLSDEKLAEYKAYKEARLAKVKPLVLDRPPSFSFAEEKEVSEGELSDEFEGERVEPKNPRRAVYGRTLEDVKDFFNSEKYDPAAAKSTQGPPKLFTKEEEDLLSMQKPDLAVATSSSGTGYLELGNIVAFCQSQDHNKSDKWLPLHTFAASGESFLVDSLLEHDVDINAADKDGLTALHKAIIGKKRGIANYLLRNSANPFVQDKDGATLMHYAVQTAAIPTIRALLFYNVDINLQDNDGWTPLHLAVQTQRADLVKLLLIKGADKTLKNKDGLTALDLCLYFGQSVRTYKIIKLLKRWQTRTIDGAKRQDNTTSEIIGLASEK